MALSDPLGSNILIGGVGGSSTLGANADTIGDQFVPEIWGQAVLDSFNKNTVLSKLNRSEILSPISGATVENCVKTGEKAVE